MCNGLIIRTIPFLVGPQPDSKTLHVWKKMTYMNGRINLLDFQVGVSKNRGGPPKWMVKIMENPIKMDDSGGKPHHLRKPPM